MTNGQKSTQDLAELAFSQGLLPHILVRRAGVPPSGLDELALERTLDIIDRYLQIQARGEELAPVLTKAIEKIIGAGHSPAVNGELIQLRRDIHNNRSPKRRPSEDARAALTAGLCPERLADLDCWLEWRLQQDFLLQEGQAIFARETASARSAFKRLVRNREFRKGLSLASPLLSYELDQYLGADGPVRRLRRTELSLIRYYTRSAFKLSPFSSFMRDGIIRLSTMNDNGEHDLRPRRSRIHRSAKLNQALLGHLAHWIARHPRLGDFVPLFRNSSLSRDEHGKTFLFVQRRYSDTIATRMRASSETLITLPDNPGIDWIISYLQSHGGILARRDLVAALAEPPNNAVQAAAYVEKLIELGVLTHKIPFPQDESSGVQVLISFLADIPLPEAAKLKLSLEELGIKEQQFTSAGPTARSNSLAAMRSIFDNAFTAVGAKPISNWNGPLLYEDCIDGPVSTVSAADQWRPAIADLQGLFAHYGALLDCYVSFRETLKHVLQEKFDGGPVPFLVLCNPDFSDKIAQQWNWENYTSNPYGLAHLAELVQLRGEFAEVISRSADVEEVDIAALARQYQWPERVRQLDLAPLSDDVFCLSCHCQPVVTPHGDPGLVLNAINNGPVRSLLRACSALPKGGNRDRLLGEIRDVITHIWPDAEPCELLSTFDYNANLHARVTECVINYEDNFLPGIKEITLAEIVVKMGADGRIALLHGPSGKRILPLDLGMMASLFKPTMQHFLLSTGHVDFVLHKKPFHPYFWSRKREMPGLIEQFPRLTFGSCIVRRRGWSIPFERLPQPVSNETEFEYCLRVRRWQQSIGLPNEVFVSVESMNHTPGLSQRQEYNRRKPQYINFGNHLLIQVLAGLIHPTTKRVYFEEMLPDRKSWEHWKLHRPTELVLDVCGVYGANLPNPASVALGHALSAG